MKALTVEEVRNAVLGRWLARGEPVVVGAVTTDTRTARVGDLFFALRGERMDGHAFLRQAAEAGCAAALVAMDAEVSAEIPGAFRGGVIGVPDTTAALGDLAAWHRGQVGTTVVGVTGSNGKTTVKRMIHHILSRRLAGTCSPKSFNNNIGVPLTLLAVRPGDDYVVCELGTNAPGEIAALTAMARPDVAVITSVGPAHLERLGSLERIAAEKASILGRVPPGGLGVIWADSDILARTVRSYECRRVRFGESEEAELRLTGCTPLGRRQQFEVNGRLTVDLPLPGRHNALNALAALAVAQRFGFEQDDAAAALASFAGEAMRLEWIELPDGTIINDAYNANPASLAAAADVLTGAAGTRKVLLVGDMLELGDQAEALHRQAGADVAGTGVDLLVSVGPLGRYIAQGAAENGTASASFRSAEDAADALADLICPGDTVLIKGSRGMAMEALVGPVRAALGGAQDERPND